MAAQPPTADAVAPILVVDDSAGSRMAIRAMLAPLGHPIVEAVSGRDALRAVSVRTFALILMDVRMPTLDGYETAKLMRERQQTARTPIVFVSAFGRDEAQTVAAYASGAVDFIFTPILPDVLRAKASALVALFLQTEELQRSVASITTLNLALRDSEIRARAVLQNVADGIVTAGAGGLIESVNRSACRLFGYSEDEVVGRPLELLVAASRRDELSAAARDDRELLADEDSASEPTETQGCRKDGSCFPVELHMSRMQVGEGGSLIVCIRDISGRKAYTDALEHRALHDGITGLPNGALFADRIDQSIATAERSGESRAVLVLDLDGFREVNDSYGRHVGDALLHAVAGRLRGTVRDADTVARLEGDAFGFLPAAETGIEGAAAESALINADAPAVLELLHAMGERLAIDDFGTGHASLVYLQQLPLDELKVDRSFVTNLATVPSDAVIARSTIDLAHNLGLNVVAEGVEDEPALQRLIEYGCDCVQGFLFSRPLPADELTEWLMQSPYGSSRESTPRPARSGHA